MNLDAIEALAAVLDRAPQLSEVEVRYGTTLLRLRRGTAPQVVASPVAATAASEPAVVSTHQPTEVAARVVGIFHAMQPPLQEGDTVSAGQVLGHIETMRIENECTAPAAGRIVGVSVRDGQPVEYGQPLFEIQEAP